MQQLIKQCVGIDCAKDKLDCCFGSVFGDMSTSLSTVVEFRNNKAGFVKMTKWANKLRDRDIPFCVVVEATGVYHEKMVDELLERGIPVSVVLPKKIKSFRGSLDVKTDTDKTAAAGICRFGLSRSLTPWQRPNPLFRKFRYLCRERNRLLQDHTACINQLHALDYALEPEKDTMKRLRERIRMYEKQEKQVEAQIEQVLKSEPEVYDRVKKVATIKGVGIMTVVTVLAETDGFALISNKRQLVSYAGLDVVEHQSGTSIRKPGKISKRGNKNIRKALYYPAMSAAKHNPEMKAAFARIVARNGVKMKALVAVERKLLILIYTLWKSGMEYDAAYHSERVEKESGRSTRTGPTELANAALNTSNIQLAT